MGHEILDKQWTRTPDGKVILRLIEEWEAGVTEHGDVAFSFVSTVGNDPGIATGERHRRNSSAPAKTPARSRHDPAHPGLHRSRPDV